MMKILDKKKLERILETYPGKNIRERLENLCKKKGAENKETTPSFSSLIDRGSDFVVHIYGENKALIDLLKDAIWHPSSRIFPHAG